MYVYARKEDTDKSPPQTSYSALFFQDLWKNIRKEPGGT